MVEWQALLLSVAIEVPAVLLLAWRLRLAAPGMAGIASAIATAVTHPQLWVLALWAYPRFGYWPSILMLEAAVVVVEAGLIAIIARLGIGQALLLSLAANGASFLFGKLALG